MKHVDSRERDNEGGNPIANQEHLNLLKQGAEVWNQWRQEHSNIQPDLMGADLHGVSFYGADLHDTKFCGADLSYAYLGGARLNEADLRGAILKETNCSAATLWQADLRTALIEGVNLYRANLSGADLSQARFVRADLTETILWNAKLWNAIFFDTSFKRTNLSLADFSGAQFTWVFFYGVSLDDAIFTEAQMWRVAFADVDMRMIKGLDTVMHNGPSEISISTIYRSHGDISEAFLQGAGLPDSFIDYVRSLAGHPIDFYSCFISYSSKDQPFAERLHAGLQAKGVRCWFAPKDMKIGDKIRPRIDEAIHVQDKLLLLLSEHSIASTWVENEVEAALEKEHRQQREVLFPIRLDDAVLQTSQAWAATLRRTRHIGDFTNWADPRAYQRAFERLLHDLEAEKERENRNDQA